MRKTLKINGHTYTPAELTFNTICELEDAGADLNKADSHSMSLLRGYLAVTMKVDSETAGRELEQHIINGGSINELAECLSDAINESGFFQALTKKQEKKTSKVEKEEEK